MAAIALALSASAPAEEPAIRLYAAGSLRAVMTELARDYAASGGSPVEATFGASGLLRERLAKGERAEVFASADVDNAQALARAGGWRAPVVFVRNRLCALVAAGVDATTESLLDRMLDPRIKLATSTPKADPSGDYAWQVFEKAEGLRPGAFAKLDAKALKLTGGPDSPPPPASGSAYGAMVAAGKADVFLTYCTNAVQAAREVPGARSLALPPALDVGASYAMTVAIDARPAALGFAWYVLSIPGQRTFARHGFSPAALP